ncbi:hypothetical protein [Actinoplanes subglobosus]|uniref:NACHT domain-containing protein n=1 Tax=Actinoplanes subglobosus TaxID=1547892 RepID=A0ABV8J1Y6_9ACTN
MGVAGVLAVVAVIGLLVALWAGAGLESADQLASVVGAVTAIVALAATVAFSVRQTRQHHHRVRRLSTAWGRHRLPEPVHELLKAVAAAVDAAQSPMADERRTRVSVIYVRQRMETPQPEQVPRRRPHGDVDFLPPDQQPRVIPVRRPLDGTLNNFRHLFLEGGPGSGKSTTAGQVCRILAEGWLSADRHAYALTSEPVVPVWTTARQLAEHPSLPWAEALLKAVTATLGWSADQRLPADLFATAPGGVPWLVVIDGLDEVPADDRPALIGKFADRAAAADSPYRLLITSRPLPGGAAALLGASSVGHYILVPFDRALLTEFATRWFGAQRVAEPTAEAGRFVAAVRSSGLLDVAATPLLARVAIKVYHDSPDRTLPRTRHDLYDTYLKYVARVNRDRRVRVREGLHRALDGSAARDLHDKLPTVIEELAEVRVSSRRSLLPLAVERLAAVGVPGTDEPLDWDDSVREALAATGLLVPRGRDVDFVHLTFAEHLTARRHARSLPGHFDPEHPDWRIWLRRATDSDSAVGVAVLTRWSREHDPTELAEWLLSGGTDSRITAVCLLGEGAELREDQIAACLAHLEHSSHTIRSMAWHLVRRLPDFAQVTQWLDRLSQDRLLRPEERVRLDQQQAQRDPSRQPAVLTSLRAVLRGGRAGPAAVAGAAILDLDPGMAATVADDLIFRLGEPGLAARDRMSLAMRLLDCGEEHRGAALGVFSAILADGRAELETVTVAAEALAESGVLDRSAIGTALTEVIRKARLGTYELVFAAEILAALTPASRDYAIVLLVTAMNGRRGVYVAAEAAATLAALAPERFEDAVAALKTLATLPVSDGAARSYAVQELIRLGGAELRDGVRLWCVLADRPDIDNGALDHVLSAIRRIDQEARALVVEEVVAYDWSVSSERALLARDLLLAAADPARIPAAEHALITRLTNDPAFEELNGVDRFTRHLSTTAYRRTLSAVTEWARNPLNPVRDRLSALTSVLNAEPEPADIVVRAVTELVGDPYFDSSETDATTLLWTVDQSGMRHALISGDLSPTTGFLMRVLPVGGSSIGDPQLRQVLESAAERMVSERHQDFWQRRQLISHLISADYCREQALTAAQEIFDDDDTPPDRRVALFEMLENTGALEALTGSANDLRVILADRNLTDLERINAIPSAARAGVTGAWAIELLRGIADDEFSDIFLRCLAVRTQLSFPEVTTTEVADRLTRLLDGAPEAPGDSLNVAESVVWSLPERPDLVIRYATRALTEPSRHNAAARLLADLDPASVRVPAPAEGWDARALVDAAEPAILAWGRTDDHTTAILRQVTTDPLTPAEVRERALTLALEADGPAAVHAVEMLCDTVVIDPLDAARILARSGGSRHAAIALRGLVAVLADESEATYRRYDAAWELLNVGATAHRAEVVKVAGPGLDKSVHPRLLCLFAETVCRFAPATRAEARALLESLLTGPSISGRRLAARSLLILEPGHADALDTLCTLAAGTGVAPAERDHARGILWFGTPVHRQRLGEVLQEVLRCPDLRPAVRIRVVLWLAETLPGRRARSGDILVALIDDPGVPVVQRVAAAVGLAKTGWANRLCAERLRGFLDDTAIPDHVRAEAGCQLAVMAGPVREDARRWVLGMPDVRDRTRSALRLVNVPGRCREDSLAVLRRSVGDTALPAARRARAALALIDGSHHDRAAAITAMWHLIGDPETHGCIRARAVTVLHRAGGVSAADAVGRLRSILDDPGADLDKRRWAAEEMHAIDGTLSAPLRDTLRRMADQCTDRRDRDRLRRSANEIDGWGLR